jgi:uncharacterized RDD family membrane protein YckC/type II secretory pathway pseudopilin PulG
VQATDDAPLAATAIAPRYGGFWIRLAASVVDGFVMTGMALFIAGVSALAGAASGKAGDYFSVAYSFALLGVSWLYPALYESSARQATPGKHAAGLIVTDLRGQRISFGRATARLFAKALNTLTLGVGWIMVGVTEQKRGLHDRVAGTVVFQRPGAARSRVLVAAAASIGVTVLAGLVGALAVPGLLRARIAGNEASAMGALRAINAAQRAYQGACTGYATDLPSLGSPTRFLTEDLTGASTVTSSGYRISLRPDVRAIEIPGPPRGCEGAVTAYVARAVPESPGTGTRCFGTGADGAIYWYSDAQFTDPHRLE